MRHEAQSKSPMTESTESKNALTYLEDPNFERTPYQPFLARIQDVKQRHIMIRGVGIASSASLPS